jgi:hypothetical protein
VSRLQDHSLSHRRDHDARCQVAPVAVPGPKVYAVAGREGKWMSKLDLPLLMLGYVALFFWMMAWLLG